METPRYPVGMQDFARIRETGMTYVDKTKYVYRMANEGGEAYFLSRPRRFGKSLLVSTLRYYFEGRRDLFEGLAIDALETKWTRHPVLLLDMSRGKYEDVDKLRVVLNRLMVDYEEQYDLEHINSSYGDRLTRIIDRAAEVTGERVVVLIDEYDAPMLDCLDDDERLRQVRAIMRDFYSPLKAMADKLRFVFLTGITKFSQMSIFSELNNLNNISMVPGWDAICGITGEEIRQYLWQGVEDLARLEDCTPEQMMDRLKAQYDGYHFTSALVDVYNPFSLVKTFQNKEVSNHWFDTGTPTWLFGVLAKSNQEIDSLDGIVAEAESFNTPTERATDPVPVLFQSGYLTIKGYDRESNLYTLGVPNREVREGLGKALIRYINVPLANRSWLREGFFAFVRGGDLGEFIELLKDFYAAIPYDISNDNERHYQAILYAVLASFGADVVCEDRTSRGRADLVLRMPDAIYVIELKYGRTVAEAMEQLHRKDYAAKYAHDGRPVRLLGINLSAETRTIDGWALDKY